MTDEEIRNLARKITDELFTDGLGNKARRLVLEFEPLTGSGWGRKPVEDKIFRAIRKEEP